MPSKTIEAWHFSNANRLCRYDDKPIIAGKTLTCKGKLILCQNGLHASVNILDALRYAPGPYAWRVELSGAILHGDDKLVARKRKALWGYDATDVLRSFARKCALDVIHLWDAPKVVRQYLESGDESIRYAAGDAAGDAAWYAAWAAAWDAARASAGAAAWDAARASAWASAGAAAWDAARASARASAWASAGAAAWDAQSILLEKMILESRPINAE